MPTKAEQIFLIAEELRNSGFIADELSHGIIVSLSNRNPRVDEIKQALGELADAVEIWPVRKGLLIII